MSNQEQQNTKSETWAEACRRHIRETFPAELAEEYISEAEHQDGEAYWDNFSSFQNLDADVESYREVSS